MNLRPVQLMYYVYIIYNYFYQILYYNFLIRLLFWIFNNLWNYGKLIFL